MQVHVTSKYILRLFILQIRNLHILMFHIQIIDPRVNLFSLRYLLYWENFMLLRIGLHTRDVSCFDRCRRFGCKVFPWRSGQDDKICNFPWRQWSHIIFKKACTSSRKSMPVMPKLLAGGTKLMMTETISWNKGKRSRNSIKTVKRENDRSIAERSSQSTGKRGFTIDFVHRVP